MASRRPRDLLLTVGLVAGTIGVADGTPALAQGTIDLTSTPVTGVTADALAAGPDGSLWSVNGAGNTISHVTFPDLHVSTFTAPTAAAGLSGITAGPDGNMWFAETDARKIGRITSSGTISEFPIPTNAASPQRIFPGPNGALWSFNACFFSGCSRFIVTTTAGTSTELPLNVPNSASFAPSNCTLGSDGNVWCIGNETIPSPFSSHFTAARISPTGGYTAFVPATAAQGSAIVAAPDGNVWYTWLLAGASTGVARIKPSGAITEYPVPTGKPQSWIFGLAVGADGNLYFADRQTSILYELILSSATDSGTATLNTGTISIDIPEDIVPVSNQTGSAAIHTEGAAQPHCPGVAFIVRSGGSFFGGIEWEQIPAPDTCTDMIASGQVVRGEFIEIAIPALTAACTIKDGVDDASSATLTVEALSLLYFGGPYGNKGQWTRCTSLADNSFQCSASVMEAGDRFQVLFGATPGDSVQVTCASSTPERTKVDNQTPPIPVLIALPQKQDQTPVDTTNRTVSHN